MTKAVFGAIELDRDAKRFAYSKAEGTPFSDPGQYTKNDWIGP
jgi:hypothetical protein